MNAKNQPSMNGQMGRPRSPQERRHMISIDTQCNMIAEYLKSGKSITALEALRKFGCMRLASRIHDLKERGMKITGSMVYDTDDEGNNKKWKVYWLDD